MIFFDDVAPYAGLLLVGGVLAAFLTERWPAEIVAFVGAAVALATGLIATDSFSPPCPTPLRRPSGRCSSSARRSCGPARSRR